MAAEPVLSAEVKVETRAQGNGGGLVYLRDWSTDAPVWELRLWCRDPELLTRLADSRCRYRLTLTPIAPEV